MSDDYPDITYENYVVLDVNGNPVRRTSIDVYRQLEDRGELSKQRWYVYEILFQHGPMTCNEVFPHMPSHGNPDYRHNINARMTELEERGVAYRVGTKRCANTGHRATLWDVTDQLPRKPRKPRTLTRGEMMECLRGLRELVLCAMNADVPVPASVVALGRWMASRYEVTDD